MRRFRFRVLTLVLTALFLALIAMPVAADGGGRHKGHRFDPPAQLLDPGDAGGGP